MQKLCQPFYKKFKRNLITILILTIITENISKAGKSPFFLKMENKNLILSPSFLAPIYAIFVVSFGSLIPKPGKKLKVG